MKATSKIKIPYTPLQKGIEGLTIFLLLTNVIGLYSIWGSIPEEIITHYSLMGTPDATGNKSILIILTVLNLFLWFMMTAIGQFPGLWNIPIKVTEENYLYVYQTTRTLLLCEKVLVVICSMYIGICTILNRGLGWWFTPLLLTVMFGILIYFMYKITHSNQKPND